MKRSMMVDCREEDGLMCHTQCTLLLYVEEAVEEMRRNEKEDCGMCSASYTMNLL